MDARASRQTNTTGMPWAASTQARAAVAHPEPEAREPATAVSYSPNEAYGARMRRQTSPRFHRGALRQRPHFPSRLRQDAAEERYHLADAGEHTVLSGGELHDHIGVDGLEAKDRKGLVQVDVGGIAHQHRACNFRLVCSHRGLSILFGFAGKHIFCDRTERQLYRRAESGVKSRRPAAAVRRI